MLNAPSVSVVMPYYKNERTLRACLQSFATQTGARAHEIVVVDDGAPASAQKIIAALPLDVPVRLLHTSRAGQSAATNAGIEAATGDIIFMTCADIIAAPQLLATHLEAHCQARNLGVMGYLPYAPQVKMTPFMQYLRNTGVQFNFKGIKDPEDVSALLCYAPNFSVSRKMLRAVGGFDVRFKFGYQDTDLGLRLHAAGARLVFRKQAVGFHDHPATLASYVARQKQIGRSSLMFLEKYPLAGLGEPYVARAAYFLPRLGMLDALLAKAHGIEAALFEQPERMGACRQQLYTLYTIILNLAVLRGAIADPAAFETATGLRVGDADAAAVTPLDRPQPSAAYAPEP